MGFLFVPSVLPRCVRLPAVFTRCVRLPAVRVPVHAGPDRLPVRAGAAAVPRSGGGPRRHKLREAPQTVPVSTTGLLALVKMSVLI